MAKALRILLMAVGGLVALLVVAAIVLPMIIDPNDYKGRITDAVRESTGRELVIEGDIGLSVFPWLGLEIGGTRLSNAPGFGEEPFASVGEMQVRLKLLPLLRKEIVMDTVVLDGLRLNLAVNEQGISNWADLAAAEKPAPEKPKQEEPKPQESGQVALAGLAVGGVRLTDARVQWEDRAAKARYEINDLSLVTGAVMPGEPVDLELSLQLKASQPAMQGEVRFDGEVLVAESLQQVKLSDLALRVNLKGEGLPGGALDASLDTPAIDLDLERQTLSLPSFALEALGLKVSGDLQGRDLQAEVPKFSGHLKLAEFVPREVMKRLDIAPPETADPVVLGKADASLALAATPQDVQVSDLRLRLDDSAITGKLGVSNFARPAIRFDLTLDQIDADRYLPPPAVSAEGGEGAGPAASPAAAPATPGAAAGAAAGELPLEPLRALDAAGSFRIQSLKAFQLRSTDVLITLKAKDGQIRVHPAQAKLYEGSYNGDLSLDVRQDTPRIAMNEKVSGVQAGPLLKDLTGDDRLTGQADVTVKLAGTGADPERLRNTLNGDLAFAFTDGAVKGFDLAGLIEKARATLKGQPAPTDSGEGQTRFTEIRGTATVTNGLVQNRDLLAKSPYFRVNGSGDTHLAKETIDYNIDAKVVGSPEGQGGAALAELKGLLIPVHIGGTYASPSYRVKLDEVLKEKAKAEVEEKVEEKKQELQDKLKDKLDDKLKGLFR